jgi:hypothetical protein
LVDQQRCTYNMRVPAIEFHYRIDRRRKHEIQGLTFPAARIC